MGRRSRNRATVKPTPRPPSDAPTVPEAERGRRRSPPRPPRPPKAPPPKRRSRHGEPPPAPWGSFPLAEISVMLAIVLGVTGFILGGRDGKILIACSAVLGSLAGLELSLREHLAGFRSHSTVMAGGITVVTLAILFFAGVPRLVMLPVAAAVFATAFFAFREVFKRRSGGAGFR